MPRMRESQDSLYGVFMLELAVKNTDAEIETNKQLKRMFINLQCPRCKIIVKSAQELQELTDTCTKCWR